MNPLNNTESEQYAGNYTPPDSDQKSGADHKNRPTPIFLNEIPTHYAKYCKRKYSLFFVAGLTTGGNVKTVEIVTNVIRAVAQCGILAVSVSAALKLKPERASLVVLVAVLYLISVAVVIVGLIYGCFIAGR